MQPNSKNSISFGVDLGALRIFLKSIRLAVSKYSNSAFVILYHASLLHNTELTKENPNGFSEFSIGMRAILPNKINNENLKLLGNLAGVFKLTMFSGERGDDEYLGGKTHFEEIFLDFIL